MHSTSRRMLRLYLFCPLRQLNFPFEGDRIRWLMGRHRSCIVLLFTSKTALFCNYMPATSVCLNLSSFSTVKNPLKTCFVYYQAEFRGCGLHALTDVFSWTASVRDWKLHSNLRINFFFHLNVKQLSLHLEFVQREHLHYWFFSKCALIYTIQRSYEDLTVSFFSCHTFHAVITSSWQLSGVFLFCSHLNFVIFVQAVHHRARGETWELTVEIRIRDIAQSPCQSHSHLTLPTLALAERA